MDAWMHFRASISKPKDAKTDLVEDGELYAVFLGEAHDFLVRTGLLLPELILIEQQCERKRNEKNNQQDGSCLFRPRLDAKDCKCFFVFTS